MSIFFSLTKAFLQLKLITAQVYKLYIILILTTKINDTKLLKLIICMNIKNTANLLINLHQKVS